MAGKYRNVKVRIDNITFDSRAEARRYEELKLLLGAGLIAALEVHPRYVIDDGFVDSTGKKVKPLYYAPDFVYRDGRKTVAEDVKGVRTAVYIIKRRLFMKRYPHIQFEEIEA